MGVESMGKLASGRLFNRLALLYYLFPYGTAQVSSPGSVDGLLAGLWNANAAAVLEQATTLPNALTTYAPGLTTANDASYQGLGLGVLAPSKGVGSPYLLSVGSNVVERSVLTGRVLPLQSLVVKTGKVELDVAEAFASAIVSKLDVAQSLSDYTHLRTPLPCRAREMAPAACRVFDGQSSVSCFEGASYAFLQSSQSAEAVVAWINSTRTALLVWRGTSGADGFLRAAELIRVGKFSTSSSSGSRSVNITKESFSDASVHRGFYDGFQSLTTGASSPNKNVAAQILALSDGTAPYRILVSGHALGAALVSLSGVWGSTVWPTASAAGVGIGVPSVGNQERNSLFRQTVGRGVQFGYRLDGESDAFGNTMGCVPYPENVWMPSIGRAIASQRPPLHVTKLSFSDSVCTNTCIPFLDATAAIVAPAYIANSS